MVMMVAVVVVVMVVITVGVVMILTTTKWVIFQGACCAVWGLAANKGNSFLSSLFLPDVLGAQ